LVAPPFRNVRSPPITSSTLAGPPSPRVMSWKARLFLGLGTTQRRTMAAFQCNSPANNRRRPWLLGAATATVAAAVAAAEASACNSCRSSLSRGELRSVIRGGTVLVTKPCALAPMAFPSFLAPSWRFVRREDDHHHALLLFPWCVFGERSSWSALFSVCSLSSSLLSLDF
jgi:hypothetical protein